MEGTVAPGRGGSASPAGTPPSARAPPCRRRPRPGSTARCPRVQPAWHPVPPESQGFRRHSSRLPVTARRQPCLAGRADRGPRLCSAGRRPTGREGPRGSPEREVRSILKRSPPFCGGWGSVAARGGLLPDAQAARSPSRRPFLPQMSRCSHLPGWRGALPSAWSPRHPERPVGGGQPPAAASLASRRWLSAGCSISSMLKRRAGEGGCLAGQRETPASQRAFFLGNTGGGERICKNSTWRDFRILLASGGKTLCLVNKVWLAWCVCVWDLYISGTV